jgi:hypothetical protein
MYIYQMPASLIVPQSEREPLRAVSPQNCPYQEEEVGAVGIQRASDRRQALCHGMRQIGRQYPYPYTEIFNISALAIRATFPVPTPHALLQPVAL